MIVFFILINPSSAQKYIVLSIMTMWYVIKGKFNPSFRETARWLAGAIESYWLFSSSLGQTPFEIQSLHGRTHFLEIILSL